MADHLSRLYTDAEAARAIFSNEGDNDDAMSLSIERLEMDGEELSFEVSGFDGFEFTAFFNDPAYPGGEANVIGPDDFELHTSGTVADVLTRVLEALQATYDRRCGQSAVLPQLERATSATTEGTGPDHDAWDDIIQDSPMEPSLAHDIEMARRMLGEEHVQVAEQSDSWRVRLRVELKAPAGPRKGAWLLSETTASAWGLDRTKPLVIQANLPKAGYARSDMSADVVRHVTQEDNPDFLLEKQLVQVLTDFSNLDLSSGDGPRVESMLDSGRHSLEEAEMMREYALKKHMMMSDARSNADVGLLGHLALYTQLRIPTMHEYCAICDQPFGLAPMLLRTVCSRDLCTHVFACYGQRITTAEGVNTQAEIVDLLMCMFARASLSSRRELVCDPYPLVHLGDGGRSAAFHPSSKDFQKLKDAVKELLVVRSTNASRLGGAWTSLTAQMTQEGAGLVRWVMVSNRSYLVPLEPENRISSFRTPYQYLLISAPPDKENKFQELKQQHGSTFAYHGSSAENWHSILRNGLKNASNSKLMTTGAAYGAGIYLATDTSISVAYSQRGSGAQNAGLQGVLEPEFSADPERHKTGNRPIRRLDNLLMLALCEVIDHPSLRKHGNIWVAPREETVMTRFFLVFSDGFRARENIVVTKALCEEVNGIMSRLAVGQSAVF